MSSVRIDLAQYIEPVDMPPSPPEAGQLDPENGKHTLVAVSQQLTPPATGGQLDSHSEFVVQLETHMPPPLLSLPLVPLLPLSLGGGTYVSVVYITSLDDEEPESVTKPDPPPSPASKAVLSPPPHA